MTIPELYALYKLHPVVTTDSRACPPGAIFFALKGENFDGNAYAEKALQAGCAYAVVDKAPAPTGNNDIASSAKNNASTSIKNDGDMPIKSDVSTPIKNDDTTASNDNASTSIRNDGVPPNKRMIVVENVLKTLQQLARFHRETLGVKIIGITGTNGKTTTKELIARVLSKKYNILYTEGNLNNHIGVPLTLLKLTDKHEVAVVEMGANHPGEIRELADIARPDYGLITNVGYAHLEGFDSFDGVVRTKGELYDFIRETNGMVFIDKDNNCLMKMVEGIKKTTYGKIPDESVHDTETGTDAIAHDTETNAIARETGTDETGRKTEPGESGRKTEAGESIRQYEQEDMRCRQSPSVVGAVIQNDPFLSFRWHLQNAAAQNIDTYRVDTHLVGKYNLCNALAAITTGLYFRIPPEQINEALSTYQPTNNRSQMQRTLYNILIIDAYNANPSSMKAALENFASSGNRHIRPAPNPFSDKSSSAKDYVPSQKAVILGDMLELGEKSSEMHEEIISLVNKCGFNKVLLCGERFYAAGQIYTRFKTVDELNKHLKTAPLKGYEILIKGSRGIHLENIIDNL
ncbi:MAG: UDP-N-acetylmuramoyl-tripeptide--D-alanyl-D-alanine ligase [Tannerella sp.]|jgi:UDP-N-acetylmuramoyl-tripeptide--D-alanyl-D-alanine ligase|nr:UDP-N-acetylmuramoyl-tripeptide--D-alanyl-D-alanine ligase [Tannerella sp.]